MFDWENRHVLWKGTNFRGLKKNDAFMGFKIRGQYISFITHTENHCGYWNSWIGPSTKTTKIGNLRKLSHSQYITML